MKVIAGGLAIVYADEGEGPVMLMLHGWKDSLHTFDALVPELSKRFRVIRLDLPGFGGSERPKATWGVGEYAEFISVFCKTLKLEPEVLVGHSFGGRVIIKGVGTNVLRPTKIVLIASAGIAKKPSFKRSLLRSVAKLAKGATSVWPFTHWQQPLRRKLYERLGSDYFASGNMRDIYLKAIAEDLLEFAKNISVPTLLIWGSNDRATPLSTGIRLHEAIKNSRIKVLEGAGHFVHQERSGDVARLINEFL